MAEAPDGEATVQVAGSKRKRSNILEIASDLERRLPSLKGDTVASAALADTVRRRILQKDLGPFDDDGAAHKAGVALWNLVLQLEREAEKTKSSTIPAEYRRLLLHSRVLAFVIIDKSTSPDTSSMQGDDGISVVSQLLYLMGIAIRAAKACIDGEDTELGHLVLERASQLKKTLDEQLSGREDKDASRQRPKAEKLSNNYLLLQLTQLWRENKIGDADRMYTENESTGGGGSLDTESLENMVAALFQIGKSLLSKKDFAAAITWLDRARDSLLKMDQTSMTSDMKELHLAITHSLAIASLGGQTPSGNKRAEELAQGLKAIVTEDNDRRVQLIQLELYASPLSESFDASGYADVLLSIVSTFRSSIEEFKLLHHHIQKLHSKSPGLGCKVLDEFMLSLRHRDDAVEWIEKLIITRVWLLAHQRETKEELDAVQSVLSKLRIPIGSDTASAAQTLIWKRIEQGYQERLYATAIQWCRLALCHIFEAGGKTNKPLIERKLLLCCIENGDIDTAKMVYINMPETSRDEPITKYFLFKLSIKADDLEMATECLRGITISADKMKLLHACVLHARHEKAPRFMVQAMKRLADAINHDPSNQVHAPALFRCTILMLRDMIDGGSKDENKSIATDSKDKLQVTQDLVDIFGGVVDAIESDRSINLDTGKWQFTIDELEWFCRAAYNLGLKYSGTVDLRYTVCILEACVKITNFFPVDQEIHATTDISSKRLVCRFLIASALAALVRRPSVSEAEDQILKDCQSMRGHIRAFHTELKKQDNPSRSSQNPGMHSKLSVLIIFDFEGAIHLGDWDELEDICEAAASCHGSDTLRVLGDSLLRSQALVPSAKFVSTMRFIVSKLQQSENLGSEKLIKYYRCLFQAALYRNNDAAFQVLEEVKEMIEKGKNSEGTATWPEDELQFLAAVAFNEGTDWFAGGRDDQARQWVLAAASLADQCHDGGKLKALISSKFGLLGIGELEIKQSVESDIHDVAVDDAVPTVDPVL